MPEHPLRRSTDQKVILHARAEDHPPAEGEIEERAVEGHESMISSAHMAQLDYQAAL